MQRWPEDNTRRRYPMQDVWKWYTASVWELGGAPEKL
jgi:hypothetical protein